MIAWGWLACVGADPFRNEAPKLIAVNSAAVLRNDLHVLLPEPPIAGEELGLSVQAEDPERGPVRIWFPYAPGWVEFDPDDTQGIWHVPDDAREIGSWLDIVLEDGRGARRGYAILWGGDTSDTGTIDSYD